MSTRRVGLSKIHFMVIHFNFDYMITVEGFDHKTTYVKGYKNLLKCPSWTVNYDVMILIA